MKIFKTVTTQKVTTLVCDGCGLEATADGDYEFQEFISISHHCGYGSIHDDGKQIETDLCQQCFADMCGDYLTVSEPFDQHATDSLDDVLQYHNIFSAISQSKKVADSLIGYKLPYQSTTLSKASKLSI